MKTTLADQCRTHGVVVGDVIELMNRPDSIDKQCAKLAEEELPTLLGCLVEITAIGDRNILGYWLEGQTSNGGERYQDCTWSRKGKEALFGKAIVMRKVGQRDATDYVWLLPELENVYTRCQHGQKG